MNFIKKNLVIITLFIITNFNIIHSSDYQATKAIQKRKAQTTKIDTKIPGIRRSHAPHKAYSDGWQNYPGKNTFPINSLNMPFATGRSFAGNEPSF